MPQGWKMNGATAGDPVTRVPADTDRSSIGKEPDDSPSPAAEDKPKYSAEYPRWTLADLIVPDDVGKRIRNAISLLGNHETLFITWDLVKISPYHQGSAINLYGPPGTGKSMCAEAIAHAIGRPFINVNYAQVESRYVGQTPKNIEAAFDTARQSGAVLVFDEADAMLGSRLGQVTQSADHAVNLSRTTMLRQLDRFEGLVVFTTNFPENYDKAFSRRILTHIKLELPDRATRLRLWEHLLPDKLPRNDDVDAAVLADESDGLAGGDLVNVILRAALVAVQRTGERRRVSLADLRAELALTRQEKAEVGKSPQGAHLVSTRIVPPAELAGYPAR